MTRRTCREQHRVENNGQDGLNFKVSSILKKDNSQEPDLSNGLITCQYDYRMKNVGDDLWRSHRMKEIQKSHHRVHRTAVAWRTGESQINYVAAQPASKIP